MKIRHLARCSHLVLLTIVLFLATSGLFAAGETHATKNVKTENIEVVEVKSNSDSTDIFHTIFISPHETYVINLTPGSNHYNYTPRIVTSGQSGNSFITWWRDVSSDQVWLRTFDRAAGFYRPPLKVSDSLSARNPEITFFAPTNEAWIVYEEDTELHPAGTAIQVRIIADEPDPIKKISSFIHSTTFNGDVDVLVESNATDLWVSWVEAQGKLCWSQYDENLGDLLPFDSANCDDFKPGAEGVTSARQELQQRIESQD